MLRLNFGWFILLEDVRCNCTWDEYEKIFLSRWIDVENMEDMKTNKEERMKKKMNVQK